MPYDSNINGSILYLGAVVRMYHVVDTNVVCVAMHLV